MRATAGRRTPVAPASLGQTIAGQPALFTLQSLMLVVLGFLFASLIVIAVLPAYRSRIRRLTSEDVRRSVPLTEAEIRADKDKLRAQFAIRVHKLEAEGEQQKLSAARQRIELNRRDARITELQDDMEQIRSALEENVNARRVLEHTVTDRLPRLEQQLESARRLINERDDEMVSLKTETTRSVRALDEALQMNAQQRAELERQSSSLASRVPSMRDSMVDVRFEGELALRSEIEALRAKTREQASLLLKQQGGVDGQGMAASGIDVKQLRRELADAEAALKATRESAADGSFDRAAAESQARTLNARIDEQAAEIARLSASLAVYEAGAAAGGDGAAGRQAGRSTPLAAKARLSALETQVGQQTETIQRLRAELAASNERLARQAAHYMDEMRRLGAGTVPTSIDPRRGRDGSRRSLSDRISQSGLAPSPAHQGARGGNGSAASHNAAGGAERPLQADEQSSAPPASELAMNGTGHGEPVAAAAEQPKRKLRLLERIASSGKG